MDETTTSTTAAASDYETTTATAEPETSTVGFETPTEVTEPETTTGTAAEPAEVIDYSEQLKELDLSLTELNELLTLRLEEMQETLSYSQGIFERIEVYETYISGGIIFAIVVALCYFGYKFFSIFF